MRPLAIPFFFAALAAVAAQGCGGPASVEFEEIGQHRLTAVIEPESYLLLALGYRAAGGVHEILVSEPLSGAPPSVQSDLGSLLEEVEKAAASAAGRESGATAAAEPPLWTYRLGVRERWIADLDLSSGPAIGPLGVVARLNGRDVRLEADAPALSRWLRVRSLEALRAVIARPRRAEPWAVAALAAFLGATPPEALGPAGALGLRVEVIDGLRTAKDPRPIAEALIEKAPLLSESDVQSSAHAGDLSVRVLALTRAAWKGSLDALKEILTLALEYHDEVLLFEKSLRVLFPAASNPGLHARHPPGGDKVRAAAFIREIHEGLPRAVAAQGGGWRLEAA